MQLYKRVFARYYDAVMAKYEPYIAGRKRELFAGVAGTVLEIGPGTGANLEYMPAGCRFIGVEPNPFMHDALRERAARAGVEPELHTVDAGEIEVEDAVADVVISTLVLCSVPDLEGTLTEIRRVLRPGGRFLFIEHVAAERGSPMRVLQKILQPVHYLFADGCRVARDTGPAIRAAGFRSVRIDDFRADTPPVPRWIAPHIAGEAVR